MPGDPNGTGGGLPKGGVPGGVGGGLIPGLPKLSSVFGMLLRAVGTGLSLGGEALDAGTGGGAPLGGPSGLSVDSMAFDPLAAGTGGGTPLLGTGGRLGI